MMVCSDEEESCREAEKEMAKWNIKYPVKVMACDMAISSDRSKLVNFI